jgi:hypothetical protein
MNKNLKNISHTKNPIQADIRRFIWMLHSLMNEDKLWSSKISEEVSQASDPLITAAILWFVTDSYRKIKIADYLKETYKALEKRFYMKLDKITPQSPWKEHMEAFHVALSLLMKGYEYIDVEKLKNSILDTFWCKNKGFVDNLLKENPLEEEAPTMFFMILLKSGWKEYDILDKFVEKIFKGDHKDVKPLSIYWISEFLLLLNENRELYEHFKNSMFIYLHNISGIILKMFTGEDKYSHMPLDDLMIGFLTLENILRISKNDGVNKELKRLHKNLLDYIVYEAESKLIEVDKSFIRKLVEHSSDENKIRFDIINLALLIGSLEKSRKHIVTYFTEYDLAESGKIQKVSFITGILMITSSPIIFLLSLPFLLSLVSHIVQNMTRIEIFFNDIVVILSFSLFLLFLFLAGLNILYSLTKQSIKKWSDITREIKEAYKIIKILYDEIKGWLKF